MTFKPYKSYNFKDKDPVIDRTRTIVQDFFPHEKEGKTYSILAQDSGVSRSTIYKMFQGETRFPRHATVAAILGAMGYSFAVVRKKANVVPLKRKA